MIAVNELYFENILALFIAVEYKKDSDTAFKYADYLIDNGEMPDKSFKSELTKEKLEDVHALRKQGLTWRAIADIFGYNSASYLARVYKNKYKK